MSDCPNCAAMREALQAWMTFRGGLDGDYAWFRSKDAAELTSKALSPDAGKALAERVRRLERVVLAANQLHDDIQRTVDTRIDWTGKAISTVVSGARLLEFVHALAGLDADKGER